jgi:hypothetical protein
MVSKKPDERRLLARQYIQRYGLSMDNLSSEHLTVLYHTMKLSQQIIADELGSAESTIRLRMTKHGIKSRKNFETKSARLNQEFFKHWTPQMAWVLGLLFTDGYFHEPSNTMRLALHPQDIDTLEKVRALVGPYLAIHTRPQSYDKTKNISSLAFGNANMAEDFRSLGLQQKKSKTMLFPTPPADCVRHFIRGCWDGDGSMSGRGAHYTCGSKPFIDKIAIELFKAGIARDKIRMSEGERTIPLRERYGSGPYPYRVHERSRQKGSYDIHIFGMKNLPRLHDYFYLDVDPSLYMARKRYALLKIMSR